MKAKLELWLSGSLFTEMEIELPKYNTRVPFETSCKLREKYIELKKEELKAASKSNIDNSASFKIILVAESKLCSVIFRGEGIKKKPPVMKYLRKEDKPDAPKQPIIRPKAEYSNTPLLAMKTVELKERKIK